MTKHILSVKVYGLASVRETFLLRETLESVHVPYDYVEAETDAEAREFLRVANLFGNRPVTVVTCSCSRTSHSMRWTGADGSKARLIASILSGKSAA